MRVSITIMYDSHGDVMKGDLAERKCYSMTLRSYCVSAVEGRVMEDCVETVMQVDPGGDEDIAHGEAARCQLGQQGRAEFAEIGLDSADADVGPEEANYGEAGVTACGGMVGM